MQPSPSGHSAAGDAGGGRMVRPSSVERNAAAYRGRRHESTTVRMPPCNSVPYFSCHVEFGDIFSSAGKSLPLNIFGGFY